MIDERKVLPLMNTKLTYPISNEENQFMIIKPQPLSNESLIYSLQSYFYCITTFILTIFHYCKSRWWQCFYGHERVGKMGRNLNV